MVVSLVLICYNNLAPLQMLFVILLRNFAFSLIVFLISYSILLASLILFVEGLYAGLSASFIARSLMVIVPLLPHGVFEVLGYSLIALAGVRYHADLLPALEGEGSLW
jgi:uncharacterized membrane protein SpoIIM required for sporulation